MKVSYENFIKIKKINDYIFAFMCNFKITDLLPVSNLTLGMVLRSNIL